MKSITLHALALLLLSPALLAGDGSTTYGKPAGDVPTVRIAELMANPDEYLGRPVRVEGKITDVCPKRGCWIDIAADEQSIRFKVEDGVIVFPLDSKGKQVAAEGTLTRIELTAEQAVGWARHLAEEKGEEFDPASVKGPMTLYQLEGSAAVVRKAS